MKQLKLDYVAFDIRELVCEINNLFSIHISLKGLQYYCNIDDNVPSEIYSDPNRIRQVILNLMENGIKYNSMNGELRLNITKELLKDANALCITVTDTGEGMTAEKAQSIFSVQEIGNECNISQRVSVSLPIAFEICKLLGGELKVKTEIGKGSSFYFHVLLNEEFLHEEIILSEDCDIREDEEVLYVQLPIPSSESKLLNKLARKSASLGIEDRKDSLGRINPLLMSIRMKPNHSRLQIGKKLSTPEAFNFRAMPQRVRKEQSYKGIEALCSSNRRLPTIPQKTEGDGSSKNITPIIKNTKQLQNMLKEIGDKNPLSIRKKAIWNRNVLFIEPSINKPEIKITSPQTFKVANKIRNKLLTHVLCEFEADNMKDISSSEREIPQECTIINKINFLVQVPQEDKGTVRISKFRRLSEKLSSPNMSEGAAVEKAKNEEEKEIKPVTNEDVLADMIKFIIIKLKEKRCNKQECGDILVVDDNEFNRFLLVQLLTKYGFICQMVY